MRWLLTDHLGSTAITARGNGEKRGELRYSPWGTVRYRWGTTPTNYRYTGQYSYVDDFGLYFYNARWGACSERSEETPRWDASPRRILSSPARGTRWHGTGMRMSTTIRCGIAIRAGIGVVGINMMMRVQKIGMRHINTLQQLILIGLCKIFYFL